jgi:hypothetical protein
MEPLIPSPHELSDISIPLTGPEDGSISNRTLLRDDYSDGQNTEHAPRMSSSDEKEPGVAKSRRKEQNRAA